MFVLVACQEVAAPKDQGLLIWTQLPGVLSGQWGEHDVGSDGILGVRDFTNWEVLGHSRWAVTTAWGLLPRDQEFHGGRAVLRPLGSSGTFGDKYLGHSKGQGGGAWECHLAVHQLEGSLKHGGEEHLPLFPGPLGMTVMMGDM